MVASRFRRGHVVLRMSYKLKAIRRRPAFQTLPRRTRGPVGPRFDPFRTVMPGDGGATLTARSSRNDRLLLPRRDA